MRIGLPKGSLLNKSSKIVKELTHSHVRDGVLYYRAPHKGEIFLLKQRDIAASVKAGHLDVGVTSLEWVTEHELDSTIVGELGWCWTQICLISDDKSKPFTRNATIVTEFPRIAARALRVRQDWSGEMHVLYGSTESMIGPVFDFGVDCVETGRSMSLHNLVRIESLLSSSIVIIANGRGRSYAESLLKYRDS